MIETDVRMTKDGHIIVCHDDNFIRLAGIDGLVKDTHIHELPSFQDKLPLHFSKNLYYELKEDD
jgi:glycerophosphoryl diester phosphodiesterase